MFLRVIHTIFIFVVCVVFSSTAQTDSLFLALDQASSDSQRVDIYLELASIQGKTNLAEGINWVNRAELISNRENYVSRKKQVIRTKGYLYQTYNLTDSSIVYFKKFFNPDYLTSGKDSAEIYSRLGIYHSSLTDPDSALYYMNLAAEIHEHIDDPEGLIQVLSNMGLAFYAKGDLIQMKNYAEQSYLLGLEIEGFDELALLQANYLGSQYMLNKSPEDLLKAMEEIFNDPSYQSNPDLEASMYINTATIYLDQFQDLEKSEELYLKALKIYDSTGYKTDPNIYFGLGNIYKARNQFNKALSYYHQTLAFDIGVDLRKRTFIKLTHIYTEIGNSDSTACYYKEIIKLMYKNELKNSEEVELKANKFLAVVKKENQITKLEKQHEIDLLEKNKSRIILLLVLLTFLFSITLTVLLFHRKKRETALQKVELQLKNKDLVNLSLHINEKNQILKSFEEKIESDKNQKDSDKALYTDVQNTLKKSLKLDEDWHQFEVYLNDLHAGFYTHLKEKFSNLTKTELRVCSLSKLRYSLKETAQTLSISPDSVKSARYRVKKKMELTAKQDLSDYLNAI